MSYLNRINRKSSFAGFRHEEKKNIFLRLLIRLIIFFLIFEFITSIFLTSYKLESLSMEPTILSGAVVVSTPVIYGAKVPFINKRLPTIEAPSRGDIVINTPAFFSEKKWYTRIIDSMLRFITLQKKSLGNNEMVEDSYTVKRVIGIPGDTIKIKNSIAYIKPVGEKYFSSEHKLIPTDYKTLSARVTREMTATMPLTGNMEEISLAEDEYFLLGDNRSLSNDSYYWGVAALDTIKAKVFFEYVPKMKFLK